MKSSVALLLAFPAALFDPADAQTRGYATRYWDCCKAHCSWSGNVYNGMQPAPSCSKTNAKQTGQPNIQSACTQATNSAAYMCWDNVPFAVNDNLAYGFAAVPATGDICGRCYELTFTGEGFYGPNPGSSAIRGKQMIVQATNIGYDVADKQFDIAIPGGGVGLFDACTFQWGVGTGELGATYGGFMTACQQSLGYNAPLSSYQSCVSNKCTSVFRNRGLNTLYDGCMWYVNWMKVADNPVHTYKEVSCPSQLTAITGMRRPGTYNETEYLASLSQEQFLQLLTEGN